MHNPFSHHCGRSLLAVAATATMAGLALTPALARAATAPGAPTDLQLFSAKAGTLSATWQPPGGSNAGIGGYLIDVFDASGAQEGSTVATYTAPANAVSDTLTGLQPGVPYYATVAAQSSGTVGAASSPSSPATAIGAPNPPEDVTANSSGSLVTVNWDLPAANGSTIKSFKVTLLNSAGQKAGTSVVPYPGNAAYFSGSSGQSYSAQVTATNSYGVSSPSAVSNQVAVTNSGSTPAPVDVTSPPPFTSSWYLDSNFTSPANLMTLGCDQATASNSQPDGTPGMLFLLVGGQLNNGTIWMFGPTDAHVPYAQVAAEIESYIQGYQSCVNSSTGPLTVAVTTNNSVDVSAKLGAQFATDVVDPVSAWNHSNYPAGNLSVAGGDDMEPGFGSVGPARKWVAAFVANSGKNLYYNGGSADGCSGTTATSTCNDGWTVGDLYYVSAGADPAKILTVPQVYTPNAVMAEQWMGISNAGVSTGQPPVNFAGELTQQASCPDGNTSCPGTDNSPATGWTQLYEALNSSGPTSQPSLQTSSDVGPMSSVFGGSDATGPTIHSNSQPSADGSCSVGQLQAITQARAVFGDRPSTSYPIEIKNVSDRSCVLSSSGTVSLTNRQGQPISLSSAPGRSSAATSLLPGKSLTVDVTVPDYTDSCQYVSRVAMSLAGTGTVDSAVNQTTGGIAVCGSGKVSLNLSR